MPLSLAQSIDYDCRVFWLVVGQETDSVSEMIYPMPAGGCSSMSTSLARPRSVR